MTGLAAALALALILGGIRGLRRGGRVSLARRSVSAWWLLWAGSMVALRVVALALPRGWPRDLAALSSGLVFVAPVIWDVLAWAASRVQGRLRKSSRRAF